jgi:1-acyl-sn-glycerol-3-phosphate acyltransferase
VTLAIGHVTGVDTSGAAALGRRVLWRSVLTATGGIRVVGTLPAEPCVIVANHSSHADTAALLASIPSARRPVVAAAADYWFGARGKRVVCRWLASAFPVRRNGGGSADLVDAAELLRCGRDVIVFPEGTRSRDGRIAEFHSGAARLAAQAGVALVPVGIQGTRELLPVHGGAGRARVTVRIGEPTGDITEARSAVVELATPSGRHRARTSGRGADSKLRRVVAAFAESRTGAVAVAVWAFAETLVWPLLPEFLLAVVVVAAPRKAVRLSSIAAGASLAGGAFHYLLASHGVVLPAPLTTPGMHAAVARQVASEGAHAISHQPLSGIPYKAYASACGRAHVGFVSFLAESVVARGLRILAVGMILGGFGALTVRWRRFYPHYLIAFVVLFTSGLAGVVAYWRHQ